MRHCIRAKCYKMPLIAPLGKVRFLVIDFPVTEGIYQSAVVICHDSS